MSALHILDDTGITVLVDAFYAAVRADGQIGPVFNDAIDDWPGHLNKLCDFWSTVMLGTGRFKGNPVMAHLKHKGRITPEMFERWLAIWRDTTNRLMQPEVAQALQQKAERIAESLRLALFFRVLKPDRAAQMRES